MRVIGGRFRGRTLKTLPGNRVRPTPDRLRQSLFDILAPLVEGAVFVDAYAGSGAVGIEALSRGAREVIFVEADPRAAAVIEENLRKIGVREGYRIIRRKTASVLPQLKADILFMDPPYSYEQEYDRVLRSLRADQFGLVIVQHAAEVALHHRYGFYTRTREVKQGGNILSFYEPSTP